MQEKVEIITNHFEHYWTKIPKNGYCDHGNKLHIPRASIGPKRKTGQKIKLKIRKNDGS